VILAGAPGKGDMPRHHTNAHWRDQRSVQAAFAMAPGTGCGGRVGRVVTGVVAVGVPEELAVDVHAAVTRARQATRVANRRRALIVWLPVGTAAST